MRRAVAFAFFVLAGAPLAAQPALIPYPRDLALAADAEPFVLTSRTPLAVPGGEPEAVRLAGYLSDLVGAGVGVSHPDSLHVRPPVVVGRDTPPTGTVVLAIVPGLEREGYTLTVAPDGVRIEGASAAGLFYGIQTLRQLLAPEVEWEAARGVAPLAVPALRIGDAPRYEWRGAMLDVARHFFGVDDVKRVVDLMALYKLNRLHLHLSDDQGWRIDIPAWPRLATVGGATEVGGTPGGFYTLADYDEIVAYAADRFITVVPEIDMPGHTHAAAVAYPELTCDGAPREPYVGIRVGFSALCVESETTYRFLDDVLGTLAAHTPGPWLHVGGDEVQTLSDEQYATFMKRVDGIVQRHGKQLMAWDEAAPVALRPGSTLQLWRPLWDLLDDPAVDSTRRARAEEHAAAVREAVARGSRVVLSPADHVYLDMKLDSTTALGLAWAGYNNVQDAYAWSDAPWTSRLPAGAIAGIEAPLWTETVASLADVETMLLPRLPGVAERGWSPEEVINWQTYRPRLAAHAARWEALGFRYTRSPEVWPGSR
jgi:hexosaminidase